MFMHGAKSAIYLAWLSLHNNTHAVDHKGEESPLSTYMHARKLPRCKCT